MIKLELHKLLDTTGLTRKRVLVRRKGEKPFWSFRWVQQDKTVKETVEAAGFELVAVEGEEPEPEPEPVKLEDLIQAAYVAGIAAFEAGLPNRSMSDPKLRELTDQNPGGISDEIKILEGWAKGWHQANATAPVPDIKSEVKDLETLRGEAREAGKIAYEDGYDIFGEKEGLSDIIAEGDGDDRTSRVLSDEWIKGYRDARGDKIVSQVHDEKQEYKHTPTGSMNISRWGKVGTVLVGELREGDVQVLDHGKERKIIGINKGRNTSTLVFGEKDQTDNVISLDNNIPIPLKSLIEVTPDNFDTMPDVEPEPSGKIPIKDRISGIVKAMGVPGVLVGDLQIGDVRMYNDWSTDTIINIEPVTAKTVMLTYSKKDPITGLNYQQKLQTRTLVPVVVPKDEVDTKPKPEKPDNFDTMPDMERLTVADVEIPAFKAGEAAFKRGTPSTHGGDDPELIRILESLSHLDEDERFGVLRHWLDGWDNAKLAADIAARPKVETPQYGTPLSERLDKTSRMRVPGVGTVPAIKVKDIQIGDRLHFVEGVYRVKGVIVKGASSIISFHEKDTDGNDIRLKKQNRSVLPVEETQLTPDGYTPRSWRGEPESNPHWAMTDESEEKRELISTASDFVPSKTIKEATDRLEHQFLKDEEVVARFAAIKNDVSFDGLKLPQLNSIIDGLERTIGKYNVKIDQIGWNERKHKSTAQYTYFGNYCAILFQKTAAKNPKAHQKKVLKNFEIGKDRNLAKYEKYLGYKDMSPGYHDDLRDRIAKLEKLERWVVDVDLDNSLLGIVVHEGHHAIYHYNKLDSVWYDNIRNLVGPKLSSELKCASVSEYGMTEMGELFAEVGVAVEFGVEIDPDVKQAYLNTMETIK